METIKTELCIIGGGEAGLALAAAAAPFGTSVVMVTHGELAGELAGENSDAFRDPWIALRRLTQEARAGRRHAPLAAVRRALGAATPYHAARRYGALGARIIDAKARFTGQKVLEAGESRIEAKHYVIAVGTRPVIPALPGLEDAPYLTTETLFDLPELPTRLAILGGGAEAAELAQTCRMLGAEVMLITEGSLLPDTDAEAVLRLRRRLAQDGVVLLEHTRIARVQALTSGVTLDTEEPDGPAMHNASHLLIAAGREAKLEDLGLAAAGVTHDAGGITVDARLRTANPAISVAGAAIKDGRWPHGAASETSVLFRNIALGLATKMESASVPAATGTMPSIASAGLQEHAPLPKDAVLLRQPLDVRGRSGPDGFVKAIIDRKGHILGVTIVAPDAASMIAPWALAMRSGLSIEALATLDTPFAATDEASRRTALQAMVLKLRNPWTARLLRLKRVFG